jgi:RNA polymerase sigma-70 factor (ECF subfamily)
MDSAQVANSSETNSLLKQAASGDQPSWTALLSQQEGRLRRLVALRLDQRLQGRIDPEDVLQEAYLEAWKHLPEYCQTATLSFYVWLRAIVGHKLLALHRFHLGTDRRAAGRELSLNAGPLPEASSAALAAQLLGNDTRPSEAAIRAERKLRLQEAIDSLDALDREVLALRHFEQLTTLEVAEALGITQAAAGKRHLRALERLKDTLRQMPGGLENLRP